MLLQEEPDSSSLTFFKRFFLGLAPGSTLLLNTVCDEEDALLLPSVLCAAVLRFQMRFVCVSKVNDLCPVYVVVISHVVCVCVMKRKRSEAHCAIVSCIGSFKKSH